MHQETVVAVAAIGLASLACQWLAWRTQLPAILFLLLAGILAGPVAGWLNPDALFGDLLFPLVSLSVAVILFEGSLTLRFSEIRGLEKVVQRMVGPGILVSGGVTALAAHYFVGFGWELAALFGAVMVVTGPTVIVPMLRTVRPSARIAHILRWEGILIDPIGAVAAVLVFEFILISAQGDLALPHVLVSLGQMILVGSLVGAVGGLALGQILRRHLLPDYLHNFGALVLVFAAFGFSNGLEAESGLLAVTVMGIWLANTGGVSVEDLLDFKETLSILLISGLFILLAARIDFGLVQELGWGALGVFLAMQFVGRPLKVAASTAGSGLKWQERALISWIGPRGIIAAAISAVFAVRLQEAGFADARYLVPLTFMVIIGTVVLQSATAGSLARLLGVAEPQPKGFLVVGANPVARAVGRSLVQHGFRALLADTHWENVRQARMDGLDVYYGNPVSDHADRHLDLVGVGRMLGLSPQTELNAIAGAKYAREFGKNRVYALQTAQDRNAPERLRGPAPHSGYVLFGADVTYAELARRLAAGAQIRATRLTESFGWEQHREGSTTIPLFAIDPKGRIEVFVEGSSVKPGVGWIILGLPEEAPSKERRNGTAEKASANPQDAGASNA